MMSHHFIYWTTTRPPAIGYNNPTSGRWVYRFTIESSALLFDKTGNVLLHVKELFPSTKLFIVLGLWGKKKRIYIPPRWRVVGLRMYVAPVWKISLFPTTLFIEEGGKPPCLTTGFLCCYVSRRGNRNPFLTYRERVNESLYCVYVLHISARNFFFLVPTGRDEAGLTIPIVAIIITK